MENETKKQLEKAMILLRTFQQRVADCKPSRGFRSQKISVFREEVFEIEKLMKEIGDERQ